MMEIAGKTAFVTGAASELMSKAFLDLPSPMRSARLGTTGTTSVLIKVLQATSLASLGDFAAAERSLSDSAAIALETGGHTTKLRSHTAQDTQRCSRVEPPKRRQWSSPS
jgi:hypothetical protein